MAKNRREWFRVVKPTAKAGGGNTLSQAAIHINDVIGADPFFGGVDAAELIAEIDDLDVDELDVRINSQGGSAYDGLAIANAIMRNRASTTTHVDGLAASAASLIALAGDKVIMSKYGQMMLHNSSGGLYGTADQLRDYAKFLDSLNASMADFYADRAGGDAASWTKAMSRETWYRADEALAAGLVTDVDDSARREEVEAAVAAALARPSAQFKYPGRQAAPAPDARDEHAKAAASVNNSKGVGPVPDMKEDVAQRLGLGPDATDEEVLAALDKLVTTDEVPEGADGGGAGEGADGAGAAPELVGAGTGTGAPAGASASASAGRDLAAAAAKLGVVVMDPAMVAKLQSDAAAGVQAREAQVAEAQAKVVDEAIAKGKIVHTPDNPRRDHWLALMKADPKGTATLLDSIPVEFAVPLTEIGHGTEPQASSATAEDEIRNDPRFKNWSI